MAFIEITSENEAIEVKFNAYSPHVNNVEEGVWHKTQVKMLKHPDYVKVTIMMEHGAFYLSHDGAAIDPNGKPTLRIDSVDASSGFQSTQELYDALKVLIR